MLKPQKFGQYVMVKRLSTGGMAEVFLTKAAGLKGFEKIVAIKRILPWASEDDEFTTMFIDEAKISARLSHANIAQVHEFGKENGQYFLAMEYIPGQDLKSIREHLKGSDQGVPIPMVLHVGARLCQALDYAHQLKAPDGSSMELIHRDVSPPNVIVSYDGGVKLIDFGIAKAAARATRTRAGRLKGKIAYMSPEQVQGIPIDHRSDIFSIGILLYELLTRRDLFHGKNQIDTMNQVRRAEVDAPSAHNPDVPPEVDQIVLTALARDRDQRYSRASRMREDIQRYLVRSRTVFSTNHLAEWMQSTFAQEVKEERELRQQIRSLRPEDVLDEAEAPPAREPSVPDTAPHAVARQPSVSATAPYPVARESSAPATAPAEAEAPLTKEPSASGTEPAEGEAPLAREPSAPGTAPAEAEAPLAPEPSAPGTEPEEEPAGEQGSVTDTVMDESVDMAATPVDGVEPVPGGFPGADLKGSPAHPEVTPTDESPVALMASPGASQPEEAQTDPPEGSRPVRMTPAGFAPAGKTDRQLVTPTAESPVDATIAEHRIPPAEVADDLFDEEVTPQVNSVEDEPFDGQTISEFGPGVAPVPDDLFAGDSGDEDDTPMRGTVSPLVSPQELEEEESDDDTPVRGTVAPPAPAGAAGEATTEMDLPSFLVQDRPSKGVGRSLSPEQEEALRSPGYSAFNGVPYGEDQPGDSTDEEAIVMRRAQSGGQRQAAPEYLGGFPGEDEDDGEIPGQYDIAGEGTGALPSSPQPGVIAPGDQRDQAVVGGSLNMSSPRSGIIAPGDRRDQAVVGGSLEVPAGPRSTSIAPGDRRDRAVAGGSLDSGPQQPRSAAIAPGDHRDRAVVGGSLEVAASPAVQMRSGPENAVSVEGVDDDLVTSYFSQQRDSMPAVQDNAGLARPGDISGTRMITKVKPGFSSTHIIILATCLTLAVVGLAFIAKMILSDGGEGTGAVSQDSGTLIVTTRPTAACSVSLDTVAKGWLSPGKPLNLTGVDPGVHDLVIVCPEFKQYAANVKVASGKISYVEALLHKE